MLFITEKELELKTSPTNDSGKILLENKVFARETTFPKSYRDLAIYMAKINARKNIDTVIVEHESDLSIWSEVTIWTEYYEQELKSDEAHTTLQGDS